MMVKINVVNDLNLNAVRSQTQKAVRGKKGIRFQLLQYLFHRMLKKSVIEQRVTCGRGNNQGSNIIRKNKFFIKRSVKQKNKMDIGIRPCNPNQGLIGKPTYSLQSIFKQEPCIDNDLHSIKSMKLISLNHKKKYL